MLNLKKAVGSVLSRLNDDAIKIQQNSEVVTWEGNVGWNSGYSGDYERLNFVFNRLLTQSGVQINGQVAMTVSAFWSCVKMIAEDIAKLPINLCETDANKNKQIRNNHWAYNLVSVTPDGQIRAQKFWETMFFWANMWGNSFAILGERNPVNGQISYMQAIHPNRVTIRVEKGIRFYTIYPSELDAIHEKNGSDYPNHRVYHLDGIGDQWSAYPIVTFARECLGISISLQTLQSSLFSNGLNLGGTLETEQKLDKTVREEMANAWMAKFGGAANANKVAVLDKNLKYSPMPSKSVDSEVLDSRNFQVLEVARFFRVPPHKLGITDASTMNNMEQENKSYYNDTLSPWTNRAEKEASFKLLPATSKFYMSFDSKSLTMPDIESKTKFWDSAIKNAAATPNMMAQAFDLPTYSKGDTYYFQSNNLSPVGTNNDKDLKKSENMAANEPARRNPFDENQSISKQEVNNYNQIQQFIASALNPIIKKEINFVERYEGTEKLKSKSEDFYLTQVRYIDDILQVYYDNFNFDSEGFAQKWAAWQEAENWKDEKASKIAEDFISKLKSMEGQNDGN